MEVIVCSKTNVGRSLAFKQNSRLMPALRDLLRRIEGKTLHQQLVPTPILIGQP
jgi:septum formation inhibitor-activating ATPase MinD